MAKQQALHAPTLTTIRMVEETLKRMPESLMTVAELKRALPRQVNHTTLLTILDYLEESGKIYVTIDGITWIHVDNPLLRRAVKTATEH